MDGARIREATRADTRGIARVHLDSSGEAYAPLARDWPAPDLDARTADWEQYLTRGKPGTVQLVAELEGTLVAFIQADRPRRG